MNQKQIEEIKNLVLQVLIDPNLHRIGLYFYPASNNDLTPLLLMPPNNPLKCTLLTYPTNNPIPTSTPVLPVLMDCNKHFKPHPAYFDAQPYPELWQRFRISFSVLCVLALPLNGDWFLAIVELNRQGARSIHPVVFCQGDAHKALASLHPATNFYALALIRCSGFSGGPTGECSYTLSQQISRLPFAQKPQYIIADSQASRSVARIPHYAHVPDIGLENGWGWPPVSVFKIF